MNNIWSILSNKHQGELAPLGPIADLLEEHKLEGYVYSQYKNSLNNKDSERLRKVWQGQWIRNQIYQDFNRELYQKCSFQIATLKGGQLLGDVFADPGQRFLSDIDLLVDPSNFQKLSNIIKSMGGQEVYDSKWSANNFKAVYQLTKDGYTITVELHSRLFYKEYDKKWIINDNKLSREDFLIHLVGHLSYQHTFLALYWLLDIHLYINKYHQVLDWEYIIKENKKLKQVRCLKFTFWILSNFFGTSFGNGLRHFSVKNKFYAKLFTSDFLLYPMKSKIRYYLIKHLTKDNLMESMLYDILWLGNKFKRIKCK